MPIDPGPHDLDQMRLILGPEGKATIKAAGPAFYAELDQEFGDFSGHVLIQKYEFDEPWTTWEMHPEGDEFLYLLEGETDLLLYDNGNEQRMRFSEPGSYMMVPRGVWHTAEPRTKTVLLFVTPGEGTVNAESPPGR